LESEAECVEVANEEGLVADVLRHRPDVCILAFDSQVCLRVIATLVAKIPGTVVIMLARNPQEGEFLAAMRAGASGYLPHELDPARLPALVRAAARGEAMVPRQFVGRLVHELRDQRGARRSLVLGGLRRIEFTSREWETLALLRRGLSTGAIADELRISSVTVRRHLSGAYVKLGASSRREALEVLEESDRAPSS
jgi:DNA-binding NarL/FixJ family response regulator